MTRFRILSAIAATALAPSAALCEGAHQQAVQPAGEWINPHGTVKVETGNCNDRLCGWVVWASPKAQTDAKDAGIKTLLGTELLRDYQATGNGRWKGQVYVPDMGRSFYSTITQMGTDRLRISGCILGGWLCKTQIWQRS